MSTKAEVIIVLRAAKTLRDMQVGLVDLVWGTPEYNRLVAALRRIETQFDEALDIVLDELIDDDEEQPRELQFEGGR
jgi:hypothetical protein